MLAAVCRYNDRVRAGDEAVREVLSREGNVLLATTQLIPAPGSDAVIAVDNLDPTIRGVLRPPPPTATDVADPLGSGKALDWLFFPVEPGVAGEGTFVGDPAKWSELEALEGCDERTAVINARYRPVACVVPTGAILPLEGSPGVPTYASDLIAAEEIASAVGLQRILDRIEEGFVFEARVVLTNDGKGDARDVETIAPPGYRPIRIGSVNPCGGEASVIGAPFLLRSAESCEVRYRGPPARLPS